ncbi:MAG: alpha/beta hydrolase [Alphaproteobacteria bacterium]|nr:alpha/beta hydrolase [Alphaproteobacteria bacterium]
MPTTLVRGRRVAYLDSGDGEPVLLLHSSSSSGAQWSLLVEELRARGYRALAPDLLGYGDSEPWPAGAALDAEDEFALVRALADIAGAPIHLVGHSYGAAISLRMAMADALPLRSLVLYEPVLFSILELAGETALHDEIRRIGDNFIAAVARGDPAPGVGGYVDYWNGDGAWAALPDNVRARVLQSADKVAAEWAIGFAVDFSLADMAAIAVPTLVARGGATNATTARIAELVAATIDAAHLATIEGARHMGPITHGEAVNREILLHLENVAR